MTANILPDSRGTTGFKLGVMGFMVPLFCASCGVQGGSVPEENCTFAFWTCNDCDKKYGELTGAMVMPDEVFWAEVNQAQLEKYGRFLSAEQIVLELADPESLMSTLARSRASMTPKPAQ